MRQCVLMIIRWTFSLWIIKLKRSNNNFVWKSRCSIYRS